MDKQESKVDTSLEEWCGKQIPLMDHWCRYCLRKELYTGAISSDKKIVTMNVWGRVLGSRDGKGTKYINVRLMGTIMVDGESQPLVIKEDITSMRDYNKRY